LNSFPPLRSKEKLVSAETVQGNMVSMVLLVLKSDVRF